jgi:hypothetical protein
VDSLISEAQEQSKVKRARSRVLIIADTMPDDLRAEFAKALANPNDDITAAGLAKALQARGYKITKASIQHFREQGSSL